jgi:spermidine synthase
VSRSHRLPFVIFFLSGASGLAYEVVWTRLLGLAVGHTTVALTAVLAAFMGGLAGGSAYFARRLEQGARPLPLYAQLEVGIALLAVAFPIQLAVVSWLSVASARTFDSGTVMLGLVRFCLAAFAVVPATFLMGGTMPAMIASMSSARTAAARPTAHHAGILYAVNTTGAVVGAALAGFVLIERFGTIETAWLAAAGNLLAAALALTLVRARQPGAEGNERASVLAPARSLVCTEWRDHRVLAAYLAAGFSALALQVVWTRVLVFFAGSTTYAFTSILIVFLSGIAIGSAIVAPFVDRLRRPAVTFAIVQMLVGLSAAWSIRVLRFASPLIDAAWPPDETWLALVFGNFAKAAVTTAVPTLLMGVAFPIAVRLARDAVPADTRTRDHRADDEERLLSGAVLGRLYAGNTTGAIGGAALTGLVFVPFLGVTVTLGVVALISVAAGMAVVWRVTSDRRAPLVLAVFVAAAIVWGADRTTLHVPVGSERLVFYEEGMSATISVLEEVTGTRTIYIDRVPVAGTDAIMLTDQKSLAHVPMLLNPEARHVLTVGFGSGGASWSFARYRRVERVDAVEIDPSVFHAAPHLEASNHGVWKDPRFRLILEDARNYLASTDATYDVIATDCTDLRYKSNANLYTVDYFALLRGRLNPGGIATVWMPLGGLGGDTFRMALRTFREVFPHSTVWYMTNQPTHYLLLVGSDRVIRPDVDVIATGLGEPEVRSDLAEIRLDDPLKVASSLLLDEKELARLAGEGPLNTDRHPLLEFQAPRLAYRDSLATNLRATLAAVDIEATVGEKWRVTDAQRASLAPYIAATPALIEGHARYQLATFDYEGALRLYRAAAATNPTDTSIPALVADVERTRTVWLQEFAARTDGGSVDSRDWMAQASLLRQVGRAREAVEANRRATELSPSLSEAWVRLAATQAATGDSHGAIETLEHARTLVPDEPVLLSDLGAAYNDLERYADAVQVLRQSLAISRTGDAHNNLGVALNGLQQPADAAREFERALALSPALPDAWFNLGVSRAMQQAWDPARDAYERGLALAPGESRALQNLALIEANAGRWDEAIRRLREAVAQEPASPELRNDLGRAYLAVGSRAAAVREFEEALRLDPSSAAIAENLRLARGVGGRSR